MDKINEVIEKFDLLRFGNFDGNVFIGTFPDSNEFSNVYSAISNEYEIDDEGNEFNDSKTHTVFTSDSVEITFDANYDKDSYSISIGEK